MAILKRQPKGTFATLLTERLSRENLRHGEVARRVAKISGVKCTTSSVQEWCSGASAPRTTETFDHLTAALNLHGTDRLALLDAYMASRYPDAAEYFSRRLHEVQRLNQSRGLDGYETQLVVTLRRIEREHVGVTDALLRFVQLAFGWRSELQHLGRSGLEPGPHILWTLGAVPRLKAMDLVLAFLAMCRAVAESQQDPPVLVSVASRVEIDPSLHQAAIDLTRDSAP